MKKILFTLSGILITLSTFAQGNTIKIPQHNDKYSAYVKKLEAGNVNIDYKDFRESYLESEQFLVARKQKTTFDSLKKEMWKGMDNSAYQSLIAITKHMLSIDYTSMEAHKILYQTCKILKDTANQRKYHDIEMGLLHSIIDSGDGTTCETAWHVIQIEEEYFIIRMAGASFRQQTLVNEGGICDKMDVTTEEGKEKTYYFEVSGLLEQTQKLFDKKR